MSDELIPTTNQGRNNADLSEAVQRLAEQATWRDSRTIILSPCGHQVPLQTVAAWTSLHTPPNSAIARLFTQNLEVGHAYTQSIEGILQDSRLSDMPFLCTAEHDNLPPPRGLIDLIGQLHRHPELAAVSGLYFAKAKDGFAHIYGEPGQTHLRPQLPDPNGGLVECRGIAMGFAVFRVEMFRDVRLRRPWFLSGQNPVGTQDLYFWDDAARLGYRCAVDCSVRVGHLDTASGIVW
jgi:hypothetical protein